MCLPGSRTPIGMCGWISSTIIGRLGSGWFGFVTIFWKGQCAMSEWIYVVSGSWRLAANWKYGGSRFDYSVPGFGWCVATDGEPAKHVCRRMVRRGHKLIAAARNS